MINLRKWFVPGKHNSYHPHALRTPGLALTVTALLLVNLSYNIVVARSPKVLGYATSISADQIISLTNQQRVAYGLGALAANAQLNQAAQAKAQDMFAKNYWSHFAPDGTGPWYFITSAGYDYSAAGENLAKDFNTSEGVVSGWMGSPGHRDNILNTTYRDIGVAAVNGVLLGAETTLVVAMYGAPRVAAAPAPAPAAAAPKATTPAATAPAPPPTTSQPAPATEQPTTSTTNNTPKQSAGAATTSTDATPKTVDLQAIKVRERRNWAQNASLYMLSALLLLIVMKHTVVWRAKRRGWKHIWLRTHPIAQYVLLLAAIAVNLVSGVGVIR